MRTRIISFVVLSSLLIILSVFGLLGKFPPQIDGDNAEETVNEENVVSESTGKKAREIVWTYMTDEGMDTFYTKEAWDNSIVRKVKFKHHRFINGTYNKKEVITVSLNEDYLASPTFLVDEDITQVIGVIGGS